MENVNRTLRAAFAALTATLAGMAGVVVLAVTPSQATPSVAQVVCGDWKMRGATGTYPDVTFGGPPAGTWVGKYTAKLKKPSSGVDPGVEFAAKNLTVTTTTETYVGVGYKLSDGAATSAGAIRFFGYAEQNADTLLDAPDWTAIAEAEEGQLVLTVPGGKTIGTLGVVYDASNNAAGLVTFSGMTVGNRPVWFTPCPTVPPSSTPPTSVPPSSTSVPPTSPPVTTAPPTSVPPTSPPVTTAPPTSVPPPSPSPGDPAVTCQMFLNQQAAQDAYEDDPIGHAELDRDKDGRACDWTPVSGNLPLTGGGPGKLLILTGLGLLMIVSGAATLILTMRRRRLTA